VPPEPLPLFLRWYEDAAAVVRLPEAMSLATVGRDGRPSSRMVLMTSVDGHGLTFDSQLGSRKATELDRNPPGAALFYWDPLGRQVRVEGTVIPVPSITSDRAFAARPRAAQILAYATKQSEPIESREALEERVRMVEKEFDGRVIPRPPTWGGFSLNPHTFEFWQHRDDRLHDRLFYERLVDGWRLVRLQP